MAKKKANNKYGCLVLVVLLAISIGIAFPPAGIAMIVGLIIYFVVKMSGSKGKNPENQEQPAVQTESHLDIGEVSYSDHATPKVINNNSGQGEQVQDDQANRIVREMLGNFLTNSNLTEFVAEPVGAYYQPLDETKYKSNAKWIPSGNRVSINGVVIQSGMVYVGTLLPTYYNTPDPCLLNPDLVVAQEGDYTVDIEGYFPSYSTISPEQRKSYLNWLLSDRRDPEAGIGFVFLFFYGLERRVLIDGASGIVSRVELQQILDEVSALREVYSFKSGSFESYASSFAELLTVLIQGPEVIPSSIPAGRRGYETPLATKVRIGVLASKNQRLDPRLAISWLRSDPNTYLRTPAMRCMDEVDRLFELRYNARYPDGILLSPNRTKLRVQYRAANGGMRGMTYCKAPEIEILPDLTAVREPIETVRQLFEDCTNAVEPYSRLLARRNPGEISISDRLTLPDELWPPELRESLEKEVEMTKDRYHVSRTSDLVKQFGVLNSWTKEVCLALLMYLDRRGVGVEPDILAGVKFKAEYPAYCFFSKHPEDQKSLSVEFLLAQLMLQLSVALANSDGKYSDEEETHLYDQISQWQNISDSERVRANAYLAHLKYAVPTLAQLKKKIEHLDDATRQRIAVFIATVANADGVISTTEIKMLESVYRVLGVEANKVFSNLHSVAVKAAQESSREPASVVKSTSSSEAGQTDDVEAIGKSEGSFRLDQTRISQLRRETSDVSKVLGNIFEIEEVEAKVPEVVAPISNSQIWSLDQSDSNFLKVLRTRPLWSRSDLQDLANDNGVLLDGTIASINEAAMDATGELILEGDDPIRVNVELLEGESSADA